MNITPTIYTVGAGLHPAAGNPAAATPAPAVLPQSSADRVAPAAPVDSPREVSEAVAQINAFIAPMAQAIEFSTEEDSGRIIVRVVDTETQQVVRQIPSEEALAISRALDRLQGLIFRDTA